MKIISEFEKNIYEYIRNSEELETLEYNIITTYNNLLKKLKDKLPNYSISFIEYDFIVDSYFDIYDSSMDITDPRKVKHDIRYKGINYKLIGHEENKYKINKVIDDYYKYEYGL